MSYQVLARKYRPRNFEALVGQEHVVRALTHALEQQRLHHAYLFTGTRGVGKTTLSRILAKSLNCQGPDHNGGITAHPCGICESCIAIDTGRFVDYIEMDAASNRRAEEMAQLLEQAIYAPSNARFKVYMIDEVHMLTNHAFNAMLKTLEEPPLHVKFILATTDPQKIPVTVLSRCLQFNLKQMPPGHIIDHLANVLNKENITFEVTALPLLAHSAHGSMRDALSLTDQAIAYAAGKVTLHAVQSMLGALDQSYLIRLLHALADQNGSILLAIADEMATRSLSYNVALQDLATLLHQVALVQIVPTALAENISRREEIIQLAIKFNPEEVQLFYQIVVHGRNELTLAPDEYAGFSMTLLRMLAFKPVAITAAEITKTNYTQPVSSTTSSCSNLSKKHDTNKITQQQPHSLISDKISRTVPLKNDTSHFITSPLLSTTEKTKLLTNNEAQIEIKKKTKLLSQEHIKKNELDAQINTRKHITEVLLTSSQDVILTHQCAQVITELNWDGNWHTLIENLPLRGIIHHIIRQSELIRCEKNENIIYFHILIPFKMLLSSNHILKLNLILSNYFHTNIHIKTKIGMLTNVANVESKSHDNEKQQAAEKLMRTDPFIQAIIREFDGSIVPGSIHIL